MHDTNHDNALHIHHGFDNRYTVHRTICDQPRRPGLTPGLSFSSGGAR